MNNRLLFAFLSLSLSSVSFARGSKPPEEPTPQPTPVPEPSPQPPTTPNPGEKPQVISGWLREYSEFIESEVSLRYPALLQLEASRMQKICPSWSKLNEAQRRQFWSSLLWSIAGPESGRNRTLIYLEDTMGEDEVTGYQIRSEGLLQLSYADVQNYGYAGSDVSWFRDKDKAVADWESGTKYGNPDRTIFNAYANLSLGLWIMNKHLFNLNRSASFEDALGKYWYVMQSKHDAEFGEVVSNLASKSPVCFR